MHIWTYGNIVVLSTKVASCLEHGKQTGLLDSSLLSANHDVLIPLLFLSRTIVGMNETIISTIFYRVNSMPAEEAAITAARQPLKSVGAADQPNSASTQR